MAKEPLKDKAFRCISLDLFRALMILNFVFFNLLNTFVPESDIPLFLRHNQGEILLFGDLVAPAFAFILGASLFFSYEKSRQGHKPFMKRKIIGFIQLLLLGLALDGLFCEGIFSFCLDWGILQSLGLGGLFALSFIRLDNRLRIALGLLLLAAYSQISIYSIQLPASDPVGHGGVVGAIGYGFISLFGIISAELFYKGRKTLIALGMALLVLAISVSTQMPFNKLEVTASFVLVSSGFCILFWVLISRFDSGIPGILATVSRHSLFLWVLQYFIVWYPLGFLNAWDHFTFPLAYGGAFSALLTILFIGIALLLDRFKTSGLLNMRS